MRTTFALALLALVIPLPVSELRADNSTGTTEELIVVASRLPIQAHKVGRSLTTLDELQIEDIGYNSGADVFRFVPGVAVSRTGGFGGLTQLRLRGAEANHIVVLIDGIDVSAAGSGEFDFASLLAADIERIEVLRGPQSGLYGSNALAGVVSIHTKSPTEGFSADLKLEGGSHDSQLGSLSVSGGTATLRGRLTYTDRRNEFDISENDATDIGPEDDKDVNRTVSAQLRAALSDSLDINFFGRFTDKDTDTDGFDFSGTDLQGLPVDNLSFNDTQDQTLGLVVNLRLADGRSVSRLTIERTDTELDGGTFGSDAAREQFRFDTSLQWHESDEAIHRTTLFLQHEEESFRNPFPFDPSQAPMQKRDLLGYGLEHRIELNDRLFLNGSLRRDDNDEFEDETTYSADFAYLLNDGTTRVHGSYGKGVTNPTFFEQFGFVPDQFVGNPNLMPEESKGWDFGIEQSFREGTLVLDLTYFDADLENEIQSLFPSVINLDGESDRSGVELSATYQPNSNTFVSLEYTYTDADEPGGEEVRRPEHKASLLAAHQVANSKLRLTGGVIYNGEQLDNDFRNFAANNFMAVRTELDSYVLVNLGAKYLVTEDIDFYVRVENLLDEDYEEVIGIASPGRSVYAGVRFRFQN